MSQLCLGEPSFMLLFGFELVCSHFWIWLNYTQGWSTCNVFCVFLFQRKSISVLQKNQAGAIAMWLNSCSYKEEFWEERTFLWHTRTRKFVRSYVQDQTSELQEPSPVYKLTVTMIKCNFSLFSTSFDFILFSIWGEQLQERQNPQTKVHLYQVSNHRPPERYGEA